MIKLYRRESTGISYRETWNVGRELIVHWGTIGQTGQKRSVKVPSERTIKEAIECEAAEIRKAGFAEIPIEEHHEIIVQYRLDSWGSTQDLELRHRVEDLLDECLGWTGNGHCDGGDIGSGTINIFAFAVDREKACEEIISSLRRKHLLEGATIAVRNLDESYDVVWPENPEGEFRLWYEGI